MRIILILFLINLLFDDVVYSSGETSVIQSFTPLWEGGCQIETSRGTRYAHNTLLTTCNFLKNAVNWGVYITLDGTSIKSIHFAGQKSTWYGKNTDSTTKSYSLNGYIGDVYVEQDHCYVSIKDKNSENYDKFHRVFDIELCMLAVRAFTHRHAVTAEALRRPYDDAAIIAMDTISNKIGYIFHQGSYKCNRVGVHNIYRKRRHLLERLTMDMAILIALYSIRPDVIHQHTNLNPPIVERLTIRPIVNQPIELPLVIRARIYPNREKKDRNWKALGDHNRLGNYCQGDERGHLIAHSLGGDESPLNIVPMACRVNRYTSYGGDTIDSNPYINPNSLPMKSNLKDLNYPLSVWRFNEQSIEQFLNDNVGTQVYVEYTVAVQYGELLSRIDGNEEIRPEDLRPTHFMQEIAFYNADGTLINRYSPITSINDNEFQCSNTQSERRDSPK